MILTPVVLRTGENMAVVISKKQAWKPECVGSFNMDRRILIFYPSQKRGIKFTICRPLLKLQKININAL
jgi:hypothetical protein